MAVRVDKRTKKYPEALVYGIPVKEQMTYLGIRYDDSMNFQPHNRELSLKLRRLKRLISLSWASKLPHNVKFLAWHALAYSRFTYGLALIANESAKTREFLLRLIY